MIRVLWLFLALLSVAPAQAQPVDVPTTILSNVITAGLTYQLAIAATHNTTDYNRKALTIQNNTVSNGALSTDLCYFLIANAALAAQITAGTTTTSSSVTVGGHTITAAQASIVLSAGGSYGRYLTYVPSDAVYVTCASTGDSFYADTQ